MPADECFSHPANPSLGITPGLGSDHEGVPYVTVNGSFTMGNNYAGELPQVQTSLQWSDSLSKVLGAHRTKFGVDVRRQAVDEISYYDVNGAYTFGQGGPNDVGGSNSLPNYVLGLPVSYSQGSAQGEQPRNTALYLFAQDSWSVRQNLTLNYGLRWELTRSVVDIGRRVQTFRPGQTTNIFPCGLSPANPLVQTFGTESCNPGTPGEAVFPVGLVMPGDPGVPDTLSPTYYGGFAPRLGLAWSPNPHAGWGRRLFGGSGKTSVRMGWGMFYNPVEQIVGWQFASQPPFGGSTTLSNTMFNTPFVGQDGTVQPNPFKGILNQEPGSAVDWSTFRPIALFGSFQPQMRPQYAETYSLTVQRQFGSNFLLQLGYVGSEGHRLLATRDLNFGQAQTCLDLNQLSGLTGDGSLSCGPFSSEKAYTVPANSIPAGFTLHLPYGPMSQVTGPNPNPIRLVGLRPYSSPLCNPLTGTGCPPDGVPVFGSIFSEETIANSNYNSFQASVEKRAIAGLNLRASYTFGKSIDNASSFENILNPLNYGLSRSLSLFDARHRMVFAYTWQLPSPSVGRRLKQITGGWTLSGITVLQSGFPVPITSSDDLELMNSLFYTYPGEPDMVKPFRKVNPRGPGNLAFDPSSFQQPQDLGRIGTAPRSVCCGPGLNNFDVSAVKAIALSERVALNFRAEFFNLMNHAQFSKVDGNISDGDASAGGTFGKVLKARDPRLVQFALKLVF